MKKLFLLLVLTTPFLFSSCTEEIIEQPFLAKTYEITTTLAFNSGTSIYESTFIEFPFEVFESDAVIAYRMNGVSNGLEVWEQLPQNFFLSNGEIIQYVFNHTFVDVQVQLDGNYDPNTLPLSFTDNQTFRFVVVPSEYADANLTMDQAIQQFDLQF